MQIILYVKEEMKKNNIPEPVVIGIVWASVMSTVEWNKKEELVAEQAIKHLKVLGLLLGRANSHFRWWVVWTISGYSSKELAVNMSVMTSFRGGSNDPFSYITVHKSSKATVIK